MKTLPLRPAYILVSEFILPQKINISPTNILNYYDIPFCSFKTDFKFN